MLVLLNKCTLFFATEEYLVDYSIMPYSLDIHSIKYKHYSYSVWHLEFWYPYE